LTEIDQILVGGMRRQAPYVQVGSGQRIPGAAGGRRRHLAAWEEGRGGIAVPGAKPWLGLLHSRHQRLAHHPYAWTALPRGLHTTTVNH
jgi:hypothetical protein